MEEKTQASGAGLSLIGTITPAQLLAFAVLVGIFAFVSTHPIRPHDFWWHLAVGREIARTGRIPEVDTFSFTRTGAPYPAYAMFWLAEWIFYTLYTLGGPALIVLAHSLILTGAYGLVLWTAWEAAGPRAAALGTLFAAALGLDDWNVRPQAFAFLGGALFLRGLAGLERSSRWLWAFPLGMLLWVNTHGSFPIGLLLIGLTLVGKALDGWRRGASLQPVLRRYGLAFLLAGVCVGANPRGFGVWDYVIAMARNPVIRTMVPEWAPPGPDRHGWLFFAGVALLGALVAATPRRLPPEHLLRGAAFALLGLQTSRGIVWFGIAVAPILAARIHARWPERPGRGVPALNAIFLGLLGGIALAALPWFKTWWPLPAAKAGLISAETPVAATAFLLRERPPGPLFHALSFGSYLIWAAQPDYPVFVDTRLELYPMAIWKDYLAISAAAPDWEARLTRYGVRLLMLSPTEQPALLEAVAQSPRWRRIYQDAAASIWVRVEDAREDGKSSG